jgi:hypothetical protein
VISRGRLRGLFLRKYPDIRKVPVEACVIKSVADDEFVRDFKAQIIGCEMPG